MHFARASVAGLSILLLLLTTSAHASSFDLSIDGADAIFLAGRTDVTIPALGSSDPSFPLVRHGYVLPDFVQEQFPGFVPVVGGDSVYLVDPAIGGIHFFNGLGTPASSFGPEGNLAGTSVLSSLGGISGYNGTQGALTPP